MTSRPFISSPSPGVPYILQTDWSKRGIGAVLSKLVAKDGVEVDKLLDQNGVIRRGISLEKNFDIRPVAILSRGLRTDTERRMH